jgi:hypothetical protein
MLQIPILRVGGAQNFDATLALVDSFLSLVLHRNRIRIILGDITETAFIPVHERRYKWQLR